MIYLVEQDKPRYKYLKLLQIDYKQRYTGNASPSPLAWTQWVHINNVTRKRKKMKMNTETLYIDSPQEKLICKEVTAFPT